MIVEDNADDTLLLERAFARGGCPVPLEFFAGGQPLIDFLEASPLQDSEGGFPSMLLLLDLKMPEVDGFQVLDWLRRHPRFQNLVVVVLSGSDQPADLQRARALGCRHYLVKPATLRELIGMARNLVEFLHTLEPVSPAPASPTH